MGPFCCLCLVLVLYSPPRAGTELSTLFSSIIRLQGVLFYQTSFLLCLAQSHPFSSLLFPLALPSLSAELCSAQDVLPTPGLVLWLSQSLETLAAMEFSVVSGLFAELNTVSVPRSHSWWIPRLFWVHRTGNLCCWCSLAPEGFSGPCSALQMTPLILGPTDAE